jgi:hypothetical protein
MRKLSFSATCADFDWDGEVHDPCKLRNIRTTLILGYCMVKVFENKLAYLDLELSETVDCKHMLSERRPVMVVHGPGFYGIEFFRVGCRMLASTRNANEFLKPPS